MLLLVLLILFPLGPVVAESPRIRLVVQLANIDMGAVELRITEFTDESLLLFDALHQAQ